MKTISLSNGVELELRTRGNTFLGLGAIRAGGVSLRSRRRPMFVEIRNPAGVQLVDYRLREEKQTPEGIVLDFAMSRQDGGLMEYMVHTVRNRYNAADWTQEPQEAPDTQLQLEIRPVSRRIGAVEAVGFSYRYHYRSGSIPIYKILDRGTWEPGGKAVGCEFWMRSCFVPSIMPITSLEQFHSTEWYAPKAANPNIFQFLPLQTELQGFTFTAGKAGTLITWATEAAHVRSLFEKPRGSNELVHWHEHCADLGQELHTAPMEVLWVPGKLDRVGQMNLYEQMKEIVHERLHESAGMKRDRITAYGVIEEWGRADLRRYAEVGLPKLLEAGCKKVFLANHFQNNMNVWGVGNMCCTVDYKVAESVGEENLRNFCQKAQAAGAKVEMWGNTSLSSLTWRFNKGRGQSERIRFLPMEGSVMEAMNKTPDFFIRNPSSAIEADHYAPAFCCTNLRDPQVREYWLSHWKAAHDNIGLEGIFLDSSFNLSSDKFHWVQNSAAGKTTGVTADQVDLLGFYRPAQEPPAAILSQYLAHLQLIAAMQKDGYEYAGEDLGVFGVHRHGPRLDKRLDCLPLWSECIGNFDVPSITKAGRDPEEVFFRGLAYRMVWSLHWDIAADRLSFHHGKVRDDLDLPAPWHLSMLRVFSQVNDLMRNRRILPKETGVLYNSEGKQVFWSFKKQVLPLAEELSVQDLMQGTTQRSKEIAAEKHHVYLIG